MARGTKGEAMDGASLRSIHIGRIAPLGPDSIPSAFIKHAVDGAVAVGLLGLAGDEQADLSVHGGPDKSRLCLCRGAL